MPRPSVLLLGKSGSGKSSVGNALLGTDEFPVSSGMDSATKACQMAQSKHLLVVDTPDLTQVIGDEDGARRMLRSALDLCECGFNVILLVMRLDVRLTEEELQVAKLVQKLGAETQTKMILVFTHPLSIDSDEAFRDLMDRQRRGFPALDDLMRSCGERCVMIDAGGKRSPENVDSQRLNALISQVAAANGIVERKMLGNDAANGGHHLGFLCCCPFGSRHDHYDVSQH